MTAPAPPGELVIDDAWVIYVTGRERTAAVRGASLTVRQGETLGIVGESGSGKSTIGRAMAGFTGLTDGTIRLGDRVINGSTRGGRRTWGLSEVQMIFQDAMSALDPRRPVWAAVAEAISRDGRGARSARPAATAHLAEVGIAGAMTERLPRELSGGERQRVTIARAMAARPSFLVCDEATSGLDLSLRGGILNLIVAARAEYNLGIVFISHDIAVVGRIADRIAVMYGGLLAEVGPAQAVLGQPAHPYTRALIAASEIGFLPETAAAESTAPASTAPEAAAAPPGAPQTAAPAGSPPAGAAPAPADARPVTDAQPVNDAAFAGCPYRLTCPVALPVCQDVVPPLTPGPGGQLVACHNPQERA